MNKDVILHNIVSVLLFVLYYLGVQRLVSRWTIVWDALVETNNIHRIWVVVLLLILYFGIPVIIYSILKQKLLGVLEVKQPKLKPFILTNLKLIGGFAILYLVWDIIGGGLREPETITASIVLIIYGLILLLISGQWVLGIQLTHKNSRKKWKKEWKWGILWSIGFLVYLIANLFAIKDLHSIILTLIAIILYSIWQEKIYTTI